MSFESADELFVSLYTFAAGFIRKVNRLLKRKNLDISILENWNSPISKDFPFDDLSDRISELCEACDKKIVLMIDEVDKSSDNQIFLSFLGLLREKFLGQQKGNDVTFHSVILAGIYDIKNLKLKLHPDGESKNNSPWNTRAGNEPNESLLSFGDCPRNQMELAPFDIAVDFLMDMSFSQKDIASMLKEYELDYHTDMNISAISQLIYDYTSGYPYLVSRICQLIDTRVAGTASYPEKSNAWTKDGFLEAIRILLKETNSLFDDMVKHLYEYPRLNAMLQNILFHGTRYTFEVNSQIINLGIMFGFLKEQDNTVVVANRIFETKMYNFFLSEEESNGTISFANNNETVKNQFIIHGMLQMDLVMKKFYEYFQDVFADSSDTFIEENGRRIFLMYLRPIINGTGNFYIEAQTRTKTRTDIIVDYKGKQFIIELKIWRGGQYHYEGKHQLAGYLEQFNQTKGYLLTFNFNKKKEPCITQDTINGRQILEIIV